MFYPIKTSGQRTFRSIKMQRLFLQILLLSFLILLRAQSGRYSDTRYTKIHPYSSASSCIVKGNFAMNWRKAADITRTNTNDSMIGVRSAAAGGYTILILTRDPEDLANSLIVSSFYNRTTRRQDVVELAFTGKLVDLFTGYRVLLPQQSRIWKAVPASLNGIFHYAPKEFWFSFYVNTTVIDKINPLYVIWYANDGVPPNSWDDFAADPNMAERYELPSTSMNESM